MDVENSGQRKNEYIFQPTHLPSNQSSYACFPPPPPIVSFIVFSCRLQTISLRPLILMLTEGKCTMLVGWMSRGSTYIPPPAFIGSWPECKTVHRYECGCFKLRALRLYYNAYRTSPNTRVYQ